MYYMGIFRKTLLLWLVIGICGLLYPANTGAFSGKSTIFPEGVEPFELNGVIMEVNTREAYLIVAEKRINVELKVGDQLYRASLLDTKGRAIKLSSFRKGQRVLVRGLKLTDGVIAAGLVKKLSSR